MKLFLVLTVAVLGATVLYIVIIWADTGSIRPVFYQEPGLNTSGEVVKSLMLYLCMILGIVAGNAYSGLSGRKTFGSRGAWNTAKAIVVTPRLLRAMIASPIVFGVVYGMARGQADIVLACVFSFENGFFCHLVLQQREEVANARGAETDPIVPQHKAAPSEDETS
jgi:hypothetical protein